MDSEYSAWLDHKSYGCLLLWLEDEKYLTEF